ncbi:uncharacterized protein LOC121379677 [Gigantopelta aegis]|uniref:uncharacterized protein LOC121379677 n=1 Tax=Gigantopelta aegis TaxID=1735272 RepID=UPI001B88E14E|nr:uncharacterized protein LOC121379677 [Gigantopelta aegis]
MDQTSNNSQINSNNLTSCSRDLVRERCLPYLNMSTRHSRFPSVKTGPVVLQSTANSPDKVTYGNLGLFITFFLIVITAQTAVSVPFNTLVADKSHPSQRGFNSGVMGAIILLGNGAGAAAGLSFSVSAVWV